MPALAPPRLDAPPEHTCGLMHLAGVVTSGCPGCAEPRTTDAHRRRR